MGNVVGEDEGVMMNIDQIMWAWCRVVGQGDRKDLPYIFYV